MHYKTKIFLFNQLRVLRIPFTVAVMVSGVSRRSAYIQEIVKIARSGAQWRAKRDKRARLDKELT